MKDEWKIPKWVRYLFIIIALLYLITILLKNGSAFRKDFPVF